MLGKTLCVVLAVLVLCLMAGAAFAADIVTVPTANQLKAGEVDVAAYHIEVDADGLVAPLDTFGIDTVRVQTLYAGLTDRWEVDIHRYDVDLDMMGTAVGVDTIINATFLVQPEAAKKPAIVLGGRDLTRVYGHASYHVSAAMTLNPPVGGPPTGPIYRAHLSLGTEDNSLFGEGRHEGLFGGLQVLVRPMYPQVGAVALYDGQDIITGVTYTHDAKWPTIKAGTFGDHWWFGANYTFNVK